MFYRNILFFLALTQPSTETDLNNLNSKYNSFNLFSQANLNNQDNYTELLAKSPISTNCEKVSVTLCLFKQISNSKSAGGALSIIQSNSIVKLSSTGFYECSCSEKGGALFLQVQEISIRSNCFHDCIISSLNGASIYCEANKNIKFNDLMFFQSSNVNYFLSTVEAKTLLLEFVHHNYSSTKGDIKSGCSSFSIHLLKSPGSNQLAQISTIELSKNSGSSAFHIDGITTQLSFIKHDKDNKIKNKIFSLVDNDVELRTSTFLGTSCLLFSFQNVGKGKFKLISCSFDNGGYLDNCEVTLCLFNQVNLTIANQVAMDTFQCWRFANRIPPNQSRFSMIHVLIGCLAVLWIIIIIVVWKNRGNGEQNPILDPESNPKYPLAVKDNDKELIEQTLKVEEYDSDVDIPLIVENDNNKNGNSEDAKF